MKLIFFRLFLFTGSLLPLSSLHFFGKLIGKLSWKNNIRIKKIAEKNIKLCFPELNQEGQVELIKNTLDETGKAIFETGKIWQAKTSNVLSLIKECENEQLISQAQQQGRGVILAIPHYGSWELVGLYCARHYKMTSMYAPQQDPRIDEAVRHARQRTGAKLVSANTNGIRAMSKALKNTEIVAILPDQIPSENGLFIPFFGQPCYTMTLLPKLAKKTNAVVLFTYAQRLPDSKGFKLIFREAGQDLATLDLEPALKQMNLDLEKLIRENPHQYQWTYNRFKKQPADKISND